MKELFLKLISLLLPAMLFAGCAKDMGFIPESDKNYSLNGQGNKSSNSDNGERGDGNYYLVSLREGDGFFYLTLSSGEKCYILNPEIVKEGYKGETMATASFDIAGPGKKPYMWEIRLKWLVPIPVQDASSSSGTSKYSPASDPVTVLSGENTLSCAFDGYLTLEYTIEASGKTQHVFSLIPDPASKSPYDFLFLHDRQRDASGSEVTGLVSFRLDKLPDPGTPTVTLRVRNTDLKGKEQITSFEYRFGK